MRSLFIFSLLAAMMCVSCSSKKQIKDVDAKIKDAYNSEAPIYIACIFSNHFILDEVRYSRFGIVQPEVLRSHELILKHTGKIPFRIFTSQINFNFNLSIAPRSIDLRNSSGRGLQIEDSQIEEITAEEKDKLITVYKIKR